jgi:hypothetical protein
MFVELVALDHVIQEIRKRHLKIVRAMKVKLLKNVKKNILKMKIS